MKNFSKYFDHTILAPTATLVELRQVCNDAIENNFCAVAVNTAMVKKCAEYLAGSDVKTDAAVGFPLGITTIACKLFEAEEAIKNGAGEVDYVVNIGKVKRHNYEYIKDEMQQMTDLCRRYGVVCKVIFENCYLTDEEKIELCKIAVEVKPDFVKTSTGFGKGGATIEDVKLMKSIVGDAVKVKAAGGVKDFATCIAMIDAGAERIGCSASVQILGMQQHLKMEQSML